LPEASAGLLDMLLRNHAWRLLMIAGAAPALLVFFVMLCVPESAKWEEERRKGATSHWATIDLLGTLLGMFAVCGVIVVWSPIAESWFPMMKGVAIKVAGGMPAGGPKPTGLIVLRAVVTSAGLVVALWGFLFPVQMYLRRAIEAGAVSREERRTIMGRLLLGAGLSGVALLGTWGSLQWAAKWAGELTKANPALHAPEYTQLSLALGAVVATILAALTADKIGRRPTYALLCLGSIASLVWFYQGNASYGPTFLAAAFVAGGVTAAFYGWFPLYLPELFRTSIRATSQGFAYNFGRVLAAIGTLQTAQVMGLFGGSFPKAGTALSAIYLVGAVLVWLGPETKGRPLPE
jgi:MFS family permease